MCLRSICLWRIVAVLTVSDTKSSTTDFCYKMGIGILHVLILFYKNCMIRIVPKSELQARTKAARGRGIAANPTGRFEQASRTAVDDGWGTPDDPQPVRTQVQVERVRSIVTKNTSPDLSFTQSINPYRGCEHGCVYCFARPSHAYLNMSPGLDFETKLIARPNAAQVLERTLRKRSYVPKVIAIGTNTDPYQPIEKQYRIMRDCLKVLRDFKHPVAITTKGTLIERDIDILSDLAKMDLLRVGVSITTLDAKLSRALEPRVPAPKRMLQMIKRLSGEGINVRVLMSPIIPGLTDHEIEKILKAAKLHGATGATWAMLRLPREVAELFQDWIRANYPNHATKVLARIREMHGGRDYDPDFATRLTGEGEHTDMITQRFELACKKNKLLRDMPELRTDLFAPPPQAGDQLALF